MSSYSKRFSYSGIMLTLSAISILSCALSLFISDIFLTVTAATVAVLMLCERKRGRVLSFVIPSVIALLNAAYIASAYFLGDSVALLSIYSVSGFEAIIFAVMLYFLFSRNVKKFDSVVVMTIVGVAFVLINVWLLCASLIGDFSIGGTLALLAEAKDSYREMFYEGFLELINSAEGASVGSFAEMYTDEAIYGLYDTLISYIPAGIILLAFATVGMICKIFSLTVHRVTGSSRIYEWNFMVKPMFAYLFLSVFAINLLFGGIGGLFTIVVSNVYTVLMLVLAYVGFGLACRMLLMRRRRSSVIFILIACVAFGGAIAFNLLALFATAMIITGERRRKQLNSFNREDRS